MKTITKYLKEIFIEGLSGMASGLFATLIIGTIIVQIASFIPGQAGTYLMIIGKAATVLTGAGIGCGVAGRLKSAPLVTVSAAVCGMVGAYASKIISGTFLVSGAMNLGGTEIALNNNVVLLGVGEPLGAFLAALTCIYVGRLVSGRTKVDILITPFCCITAGSAVGLLLGPTISEFMTWLGTLINWGTEQAPFFMGMIVSVLMGMILTLPISSAALGIILGLNGIAAGAATVGCCANMIGFAVASYRDNKVNGLLAQGLGTSMLQIGNIVKKPIIWLPAIITSAILGPISTMMFKMTNNATGSGMGTAGLVGPLMTWEVMSSAGTPTALLFVEILLMYFVLPAIICTSICEGMKKLGWIKNGDMKLKL